jgi:tetratricopeptide (TPR) repeat protein
VRRAISIALVLGACILGSIPAQAESPSLEQGIAQYRAENFEEALALLEQARAEQPESSVAAFYLGMARKQSGDLAGAIKELGEAAALKPPVLDSYLELADAWHVQGDEAKALAWVQRSEEAGVRPGQTAFLKGVILAAQGKSEEAVKSFQKAKQSDATLTQSADFQIAILMARSRKLAGARDALRAVVASDPNSEMASYAKEYEQSFSRILESHRTWHLAVGLNYFYDDNAISNPTSAAAQNLIGNPTGQRDHAFLGTLRLDYTPMLSGDALFSGQYLVQSTKYGSGDNPSTVINSLTLIPGYSLGSSALTLPVNYSHVLLKEEKYQQLVSVRPTWSWLAAPQHILQGALGYSKREMLFDPLTRDEDRDASVYSASAGYIYSYGSQGGMASLRYELSYDDTDGANWANRGHRISLNGSIPLAATVKLNLSGEVALLDYLYRNSVIPGSNVRRNDTTWFATAGVTWNLTPNIALSAQYAHTTAQSNIPVYDYSRNTFSTGVEFSF